MAEEAKPQSDKFKALARQLECDEDEKAFEEKVRQVAGGTAAPYWKVVHSLHGQQAVLYPEQKRRSPEFSTPQLVYSWLKGQGFTQSETDVDTWFFA